MSSNVVANRRSFIRLFVGAAGALIAKPTQAPAAETRIGRLINEARQKGTVSQRIDFISGTLRGTPYLGYTLIGGPTRPEKFVVRDDAFDCVTFCETVLAAAIA
ncbi:MAG: N-acetylmuramoyl-L-alanine amidase-like domain-containing protein, partial [Pseudolabrys sp.]